MAPKPTFMLFRCPGPHEIHGGHFDFTIVPDDPDSIDAAVEAGWSRTTDEAKAAMLAAQQNPTADDPLADEPDGDETLPPTRDELLQKAAELGITFDKRIGDKRLAGMIAAKLAEQG